MAAENEEHEEGCTLRPLGICACEAIRSARESVMAALEDEFIQRMRADDTYTGSPRQNARIAVEFLRSLPGQRTRALGISPHDFWVLDQWGRQLAEAFDATPYLVGSVMRGKVDYRDVDVRMDDPLPGLDPLARATLNVALTLWGRHVTGLPVDFQMQPTGEFHAYDGEVRGALGIQTKVAARVAAEKRAEDD